ncbi:MAG: hypothetical protein AABY14_02815 [Nanoarchaeota archaeon]
MKCNICNKKIEETFLGKLKGAFIKKQGKRYTICRDCQTQYDNKESLLETIK